MVALIDIRSFGFSASASSFSSRRWAPCALASVVAHGELDRLTGHDRLSAENSRCVLPTTGSPLIKTTAVRRPHSANPTRTQFRDLNEEIAALLLAAAATSKFSFIRNMAKGQMSYIMK
ncbi:hypothetical protein JQ617_01830 [Bradyrhizobium sp. KB893862 SZCCT0404]|uniref:hypothetical protein n=1 Tax=Bradyrhizobium sp. KB893862 SZCCT0404 TaxID=2807672 RepID=UPI001BAC6334|nr:hypothetical protein [Bradyrhizobium sp. KB893862 SZCCT0404]MBR1172682.1 hypothetical protein [Bradyrhizobium sp. KB893862 SZCCT0404]